MLELMIFLQSGSFSDAILKSWPIFAAALVWIFLIMRPQSQARKKQKSFIEELAKGAEVVTESGIIGRINKIEDHAVILQTEGKNYIKVLRSSISESKTSMLHQKSND